MGTATLNVRLPEELKEHGMQVLEREKVSVSELVRDIFKFMEETQEIPAFAELAKQDQKELDIEKKRKAMQSLIGILPADVDIDAARDERLMRKLRPGVRE